MGTEFLMQSRFSPTPKNLLGIATWLTAGLLGLSAARGWIIAKWIRATITTALMFGAFALLRLIRPFE
jgi:hypothetical protein